MCINESLEKTRIMSNMRVFYKSTELRRYIDIKDYLKTKKYDFVVLNNNKVDNFKKNTIYRCTCECFFEKPDKWAFIVYFNYNNQRIQSYTSYHNWLDISIPKKYLSSPSIGRLFNCYFIYDQNKVVKFLQLSEADITAKI